MNNISKYNIKTLVNLRDNQSIRIENDNKLIIDSRYFKNLRNTENITIIMQIYEHSFYHYLILIRLPNPKLLSTNINLTELNIQEFIGGIFLLLEKSLDGLIRLKKYYEYYNKNDGSYIYSIYKKLKNELIIIKNNFESQSQMNTNLENTNLKNTNLENTNLEIIILDNPSSSGLFVLYNKSYGIRDLYNKTSDGIDLDNLSPLSWCWGWC